MAIDGKPTRVHPKRAIVGTILSVAVWIWFLLAASSGRSHFLIPMAIIVSLSFSLFSPAVWLYGDWVKRMFRSRGERASEAERHQAHARWWDDFSREMEARGRSWQDRPGETRPGP